MLSTTKLCKYMKMKRREERKKVKILKCHLTCRLERRNSGNYGKNDNSNMLCGVVFAGSCSTKCPCYSAPVSPVSEIHPLLTHLPDRNSLCNTCTVKCGNISFCYSHLQPCATSSSLPPCQLAEFSALAQTFPSSSASF